MSENNVNGITGADVATTTGIIGGTIAIGQYIVNDYVITIAATEGDYGYTMTITRGTETQTVTLYGLTSEQYDAMLGYLEQAQAAAQSAAASSGTASDAAVRAEAAAGQITGMTAEAVTLAPGSAATASFLDGLLTLGIPAGETGATGAQGDPGPAGETGNGIVSIIKTGTQGNVDTYTITYTNGTTSTFTVRNGVDGAVTSVAGKTGAVTLDAGDVEYDDQQTYNDGTVGAGLADLKSQIENIQITPERTTFIGTNKSENLFNKDGTVYTNTSFNNNTGAMQTTSNLSCTYIPFEGAGTYVCYYPANAYGAAYSKLPLYNENKTFIKSITGTCLVDPSRNIAQPVRFIISASDAENVAFMGYAFNTADQNSAMFVKSETYPAEYIPYFDPQYELDSDIKLTIPVDNTLSQQGVPADAKAVGDAINKSDELIGGMGQKLDFVAYGTKEIKRTIYSNAVAHMDNSDISKPISNAVYANIICVEGNADGSVPTAFISQSENLMNPKIVCAGAENRAAGYQIDIEEASKCVISNNNDGTFTAIIPPASSFMQISDALAEGETYNIYTDIVSDVSLGVTLYLLNSQYVVTRKIAYLSGTYKSKYTVKLTTGEMYYAFTITKGAGATVTLKYPEVWVSEVKRSSTDATQDTSFNNKYTYVPYDTKILRMDVDAITTLFPGFGQENNGKANILYLKEKRALQYGYYSGSTWVTDAKSIDLSSVIANTDIQVTSNGTLTMQHAGTSVPSWEVEYAIDNTMPYAGMDWTGYGDSLTAGPDGNGVWGMYRMDVKKMLGLHRYFDCGVPMSQVSGSGTYQPMYTDARIETLKLSSDLVTIMGGTNDTAQLHPYGGLSGWGDPTLDNHDVTTFIGAYNVIVSKIMYKFMLSDGYYEDIDYTGLTRVNAVKPWFRLILITPPPSFVDDDKIEALVKICECVKQVGALWGLPVVDGHDNLGINTANSEYFYEYDETHPNAEAHLRLAYLIVSKAKEIK